VQDIGLAKNGNKGKIMKEYASPMMGKVGNRPIPSNGGNTAPPKAGGNRMGGGIYGNSKHAGTEGYMQKHK
jgi:hypothetical protein|tara:strand:+ start:2039 stop:2251 length:213 start_codon:yes stop_codon:yes gene_type:complete